MKWENICFTREICVENGRKSNLPQKQANFLGISLKNICVCVCKGNKEFSINQYL